MKTISQKNLKNLQGFTLFETAIVLLILGFVLGGLLTALGQSSQSTQRNDTQLLIDRVEEALYGFAQINGRLPCPATATSDGLEATTTIGLVTRCTLAHGFVPNTTLGLQGRIDENGLLLNSWSDALRYSVSTIENGSNEPLFTTVNGMKSLFNDPSLIAVPILPAPQPPGLIRVCTNAACDSIIANNAPAVILARGPNFGLYTSQDEVANSGVQDDFQLLELRTGDDGFVSREYNEESFDDIIAWLSPNVLVSRLITAGKLP